MNGQVLTSSTAYTEAPPKVDSAQEVLSAYEPLVQATVRRMRVLPKYREDALQGGRLGLLEALSRFDSSRGIAFAAYAGHWVTGGVRQAVTSISTEREAGSDGALVCSLEALSEAEGRQWEDWEPFVPDESFDSAASHETADGVREFIFRLDPILRDTVMSVFWLGQPQAMVARRQLVSPPAVSQRLARVYALGRVALSAFDGAA